MRVFKRNATVATVVRGQVRSDLLSSASLQPGRAAPRSLCTRLSLSLSLSRARRAPRGRCENVSFERTKKQGPETGRDLAKDPHRRISALLPNLCAAAFAGSWVFPSSSSSDATYDSRRRDGFGLRVRLRLLLGLELRGDVRAPARLPRAPLVSTRVVSKNNPRARASPRSKTVRAVNKKHDF